MDNERITMLFNAIERENTPEAIQLIESGVDLNDVNSDSSNESPLAKNADNKTPFELCSNLDDQQKKAMEAIFNEFTYTKRKGTAAVGQYYETKILTMVLFRLLHDGEIDSFYLGNNLDEAGAFDDVVFRTCVKGKVQVCCVQAKHKKVDHVVNYEDLINTKDTGGDFHFGKYFQSFLKIRYMFRPDSEVVIFQGEYEKTDLKLIIFTPAKLRIQDKVDYEYTNETNKLFTRAAESDDFSSTSTPTPTPASQVLPTPTPTPASQGLSTPTPTPTPDSQKKVRLRATPTPTPKWRPYKSCKNLSTSTPTPTPAFQNFSTPTPASQVLPTPTPDLQKMSDSGDSDSDSTALHMTNYSTLFYSNQGFHPGRTFQRTTKH